MLLSYLKRIQQCLILIVITRGAEHPASVDVDQLSTDGLKFCIRHACCSDRREAAAPPDATVCSDAVDLRRCQINTPIAAVPTYLQHALCRMGEICNYELNNRESDSFGASKCKVPLIV